MSDASGAPSTPTPKIDRLVGLDALRGLAVLGILFMNVQGFAMVFQAYSNPPVHMDFTGANATVWFIAHVFFELKFITIFSALFGAGVILMVGEDKASPRAGLHRRRMAWLLLIGLIHAHVFWWGDVLTLYAAVGFVLVLARSMAPWRMVLFGVGLFVFTGLFTLAQLYFLPMAPPEQASMTTPSAEDVAETVALYQSGFLARLPSNSLMALFVEIFSVTLFSGRTIGVMLFGMALFKWGFFSGRWSTRQYLIAAAPGLLIGLPAVWLATAHSIDAGMALETFWIHGMTNYLTSPFVSLAYASLVMLIWKSGAIKAVVNVFAATGRMALTNYLSQTLIMTFIFVGFPGLGLFGEVERTGQAAMVLGVWALQLTWSPIWLARFQFGPMEWVWRSLTYGRAVPIRKSYYAKPEPAAQAAAEEETKPE